MLAGDEGIEGTGKCGREKEEEEEGRAVGARIESV